jgi:hypothetical protein
MQKYFRTTRRRRYKSWANQTDPNTWTVASYMNFRAHQPRPAGARWAAIRLVLGLLPVMATSALSMAPETAGSRPYLVVTGTVPLRFEEPMPPPPPDQIVRPPAGAPPHPAIPSSSTVEPEPAKESTPEGANPSGAADTTGSPESSASSPPLDATSTPVPKEKPPPPAILPDDTRPRVRAEDFLPFFQFPGSAANPNDVTLAPAPPTPGGQPPSSATYRQQ